MLQSSRARGDRNGCEHAIACRLSGTIEYLPIRVTYGRTGQFPRPRIRQVKCFTRAPDVGDTYIVRLIRASQVRRRGAVHSTLRPVKGGATSCLSLGVNFSEMRVICVT